MSITEIKAKAREQLGGKIFGETWLMALLVCLIVSVVSSLASFGIGILFILVYGALENSKSGLFLRQARNGEKMQVQNVFYGFSKDYGENFMLGFMEMLFVFLWSLLFVIPGIIKMYAYSMAFYIKNDHPEYDWKECLDKSQEMMLGRKWNLFVQDLSFIGWFILGALCFGIGLLWVEPYFVAARTQFYLNVADVTGVHVLPQENA